MKIEQAKISVRELCEGYQNNDEGGVVGYHGHLNIRPAYQREFVYKDIQRNAVIETVRNGFPLNVMYWAKNSDTDYEVMDGQQRTMSLCEYVAGKFSIEVGADDIKFFHNLTQDEQDQILDYELLVYLCEGSESEKLAWFRTINIAGEKLTEQELRNSVYTGPWLSDAKKLFSKTNCAAYQIAHRHLRGAPIRQEYLETVLLWISDGQDIKQYMAVHQHDPNANELWRYFRGMVDWIDVIFKNHYRAEMKGVPWGVLYNKFKDQNYDGEKIEAEVARLMSDDDVTNRPGIYQYIFTRDERHLSIRSFTPGQKRQAYERQNGICPACEAEKRPTVHHKIEQMEADHATPWHLGGKTIPENCQMLCKDHNRRKSGK